MSHLEAVQKHYESTDGEANLLSQAETVLSTLPAGPLAPEQLAGIDQFHVRGLAATVELADFTHLNSTSNVLDAGSGFGGGARYLAKRFSCNVTGVDLTPAYVAIAELLSQRSGLSQLTNFQVGDLTDLQFPDAAFDLVWTQHVVMNIRKRDKLYTEFCRVLQPGGQLVFYDVIAADDMPQPYFPVPWSATEDTSFLLTKDQTLQSLATAGFTLDLWKDMTGPARQWFAQQPQPTGPTLANVIGPSFAGRVANLGRSLKEGRVLLVMGSATKQS
jgi:SAM-dependent methyltransferase